MGVGIQANIFSRALMERGPSALLEHVRGDPNLLTNRKRSGPLVETLDHYARALEAEGARAEDVARVRGAAERIQAMGESDSPTSGYSTAEVIGALEAMVSQIPQAGKACGRMRTLSVFDEPERAGAALAATLERNAQLRRIQATAGIIVVTKALVAEAFEKVKNKSRSLEERRTALLSLVLWYKNGKFSRQKLGNQLKDLVNDRTCDAVFNLNVVRILWNFAERVFLKEGGNFETRKKIASQVTSWLRVLYKRNPRSTRIPEEIRTSPSRRAVEIRK